MSVGAGLGWVLVGGVLPPLPPLEPVLPPPLLLLLLPPPLGVFRVVPPPEVRTLPDPVEEEPTGSCAVAPSHWVPAYGW